MHASQQPLIGVPCYQDTSSNYSKQPVNAQIDAYLSAVTGAGGTPFLIPLNLDEPALRQLFDLSQAKLHSVQPHRDEVEMTLSRWAAEDGKPTLAICRGLQIVAVAAGASLYQDLPGQMPQATLHNYAYQTEGTNPHDYLAHEVDLTPESRLAEIFPTTKLWGNRLHHQAVRQLSPPLQVVGYSTDGVIEALELPQHPFFCAVQWHPELLLAKQKEPQLIFEAFVAACR